MQTDYRDRIFCEIDISTLDDNGVTFLMEGLGFDSCTSQGNTVLTVEASYNDVRQRLLELGLYHLHTY